MAELLMNNRILILLVASLVLGCKPSTDELNLKILVLEDNKYQEPLAFSVVQVISKKGSYTDTTDFDGVLRCKVMPGEYLVKAKSFVHVSKTDTLAIYSDHEHVIKLKLSLPDDLPWIDVFGLKEYYQTMESSDSTK
jgi:hypothetical protein